MERDRWIESLSLSLSIALYCFDRGVVCLFAFFFHHFAALPATDRRRWFFLLESIAPSFRRFSFLGFSFCCRCRSGGFGPLVDCTGLPTLDREGIPQ